MEEVLKIENLTKLYGDVVGVKNLSLALFKGEILGFIGPNGAGKSTTIRSIMNLINKNEGKVLVFGKEFHKDDIETKRKIGYLPSEVNLYEGWTVKQMIDYHISFYGKDFSSRRKFLLDKLKLEESKKVEELSLGNSKKLGIFLALIHEPQLLILDEATNGLDPLMQNVFYELLLEEKKKGTTILYSTHVLGEISKICDRVAIIKDGSLLKVESVNALNDKNLTYVIIESSSIEKIINDLKLKDYQREKNTIKFKNIMSSDVLIKILSKYKIDKIFIEEATLEDMFIHYYR